MSEFEGRYILLDWNVVQYLKSPRSTKLFVDQECLNIIESMRNRMYFPFCESHLRDLATSVSPESQRWITEDLDFLEDLSKGYALVSNRETLKISKVNPREAFNQILQEDKTPIPVQSQIVPRSTIDMKKLDSDSPLRPFLESTNGIMDPILFCDWINKKVGSFFENTTEYGAFRKYMSEFKHDLPRGTESTYANQVLNGTMPFINALAIKDLDKLQGIWKDAVLNWLSMSFPMESIPYEMQIATAYTLLDIHPTFQEPFKKGKNKLTNISRDSRLVYYAHKGEYLVSEDQYCRDKAKFIFKAYDIKTKVVSMDDFVTKIN